MARSSAAAAVAAIAGDGIHRDYGSAER